VRLKCCSAVFYDKLRVNSRSNRKGIFYWQDILGHGIGWFAGLARAMISVTVVGNSILLGRYNPKFAAREDATRRSQVIRVNPAIQTKISKRRLN
jgi:hypothetical protein